MVRNLANISSVSRTIPFARSALDRLGASLSRPSVAAEEARQAEALVHVVDINCDVRQFLTDLLESVGFEARTYSDLSSFLAADKACFASCLILDARLWLVSGNGPKGPLPMRQFDIPIVLTASRPDVAMAVQAMKAGAIDFLEKPFRDQRILEAVGTAIESDRKRRAKDADGNKLRARYDTLSPREREVMTLVSSGMMNKQVAWELGLSEITVKVHRGSAMRKMAARSLPDMVRMADAIAGWIGSRQVGDWFPSGIRTGARNRELSIA